MRPPKGPSGRGDPAGRRHTVLAQAVISSGSLPLGSSRSEVVVGGNPLVEDRAGDQVGNLEEVAGLGIQADSGHDRRRLEPPIRPPTNLLLQRAANRVEMPSR